MGPVTYRHWQPWTTRQGGPQADQGRVAAEGSACDNAALLPPKGDYRIDFWENWSGRRDRVLLDFMASVCGHR
jgi:hypothetical protein